MYNSNINLAKTTLINFKGHFYYGESNPAKKLFYILTGEHIKEDGCYNDQYTWQHLSKGEDKGQKFRWLYPEHPSHLLTRPTGDAIKSLTAIMDKPLHNNIQTPIFPDKWGRNANYIELNPRVLGTLKDGKLTEGLLGTIKVLPAIPASQEGVATCIVLSELFPTMSGDDGWSHNNGQETSLYAINIGQHVSESLISKDLWKDGQSLSPDEQVKAFNDLAHFRGLKTGFRMPLSEGQLRINGREFNWYNNEADFINACCYATELGFDCIFFDSAKHVGNDYDMGNYCGCGSLPNYQQMQYITSEIRKRTWRPVSLVGEMTDGDIGRYQNMGLNAGSVGVAATLDSVKGESARLNGSLDYAPGINISNDNDETSHINNDGLMMRRNAIHAGLFGSYGNNKLPMFMTMYDLWPLNEGTNMHDLMLHHRNFSAYGDTVSHWNNLFDHSDTSKHHRDEVNKMFSQATNL